MKLVWHADLGEETWFRSLLADVVEDEVFDLDFRYISDHCIHVINNNITPLAGLTEYFTRCRKEADDVVLLQASDEWFSGGYHNYCLFDKVIRNYATWLARGPGIMTMPLGFPKHMLRPTVMKLASERLHLWSFVGGIKLSRHEMVKELSDLRPFRLVDSARGERITDDEFRDLVSDSVFAPCPMGNATNDTWRLYEALEFGCVPIVERRSTLDYLTQLFGPNPIPSFPSWRSACNYLMRFDRDTVAIDALQEQVTQWWHDKKASLRGEIARFLTGPSYNAELTAFSNQMRNRVAPLHEVLRLAELMRHQTPSSMLHRLKTPRRIINRISRESF